MNFWVSYVLNVALLLFLLNFKYFLILFWFILYIRFFKKVFLNENTKKFFSYVFLLILTWIVVKLFTV